MEILYLWIKEYKNIYMQGFNLGGDLFFYFDERELVVERNNMHIPDFFNILPDKSTSDIMNVTGIAGENGTGKTNFLDFVKYLSTTDNNDYIMCYKCKSGNYYITGVDCYINNSPVELKRTKISHFLSVCKFIYLSNILDITRNEDSGPHLFNISTNFLINKEGFEKFRANEFIRQINFAIDHNFSELIDFQLPENVVCSLITGRTSEFLEKLKIWQVDTLEQSVNLVKGIDNLKKLHGVFQELLKRKKINSNYHQFISHVIIVLWIEILELPKKLSGYLITQSTSFDELIKYIIECLKSGRETDIIEIGKLTIKAVDALRMSLSDLNFIITIQINNNEYKKTRKLMKKFSRVNKHKIDIIDHLTEIFNKTRSYDSKSNSIKIPSKELMLHSFINTYLRSFMSKGYFNFEWLELSAGQVARLNIYSRLYFAMSRLTDQTKNVIVVIDEGELYFHPEWQRKWLWYFLNAISAVFKSRGVQVIISTHSPFVLSDLPSQNIVFLKKGKKGLQVIEGLEDNQLTFASNINSLLSNSFFMNNGLVGEVAKIKINNLISMLNSMDIEEVRRNEVQISKQLRYIGEPIIRNKLFSMLNDLLSVDYLQVHRRLDEIEERLNNRGI